MVQVVFGAQWGDEGKGKIVDMLSQKSAYVVRYHGGNNAGHTVINKYGEFPLHLVPAGIFNPKAKACIAAGTVLDLEVLIAEVAMLKKALPDVAERLYISPRCQVIMPYHKVLDKAYEEAKGPDKVGTTGRGIGPVYADKVSYNGIRLFDLAEKERFHHKLEVSLRVKNKVLAGLGEQPIDLETTFAEKIGQYAKLKKMIREPWPILQKALAQKKKILCEGAHGFFLDNDWGTYPFVTASSCTAAGITAGAGIPAQALDDVIAVVKAYTTRVGGGPFPTELEDEMGEKLRSVGHEFGTTTGRSRRCGWLDLEMLRFAVQLNGVNSVALTKLDVLDDFETIPVCTGYTLRGKPVSYLDGDAAFLDEVRPVYKVLKGWKKSLRKIRRFEDLPAATKKYILFVEKGLGVPISIISVGPDRRETVLRKGS